MNNNKTDNIINNEPRVDAQGNVIDASSVSNCANRY